MTLAEIRRALNGIYTSDTHGQDGTVGVHVHEDDVPQGSTAYNRVTHLVETLPAAQVQVTDKGVLFLGSESV